MKRHLFSKCVVLYCIAFSSLSSLWALWIAHRGGIQVTGLLTVILGLFGGELLLLCLKTLLGDKGKKDAYTEEKEATGKERMIDAE